MEKAHTTNFWKSSGSRNFLEGIFATVGYEHYAGSTSLAEIYAVCMLFSYNISMLFYATNV